MALPAGFSPASFRLEGRCLIYSTTAAIWNWRSRWDLHPHSSRRQRVAFLFSYESEMVGSAGNNASARVTIAKAKGGLRKQFTVGQPDHFPYIYGSGSGSHTHLKKFMRLLSVHWSSFPQLKLVEPAGNAPTSTCLQGKCIACLPRPHEKFTICDFGFTIWQAAVVLPHAR
jgi:hypothetical protein